YCFAQVKWKQIGDQRFPIQALDNCIVPVDIGCCPANLIRELRFVQRFLSFDTSAFLAEVDPLRSLALDIVLIPTSHFIFRVTISPSCRTRPNPESSNVNSSMARTDRSLILSTVAFWPDAVDVRPPESWIKSPKFVLGFIS